MDLPHIPFDLHKNPVRVCTVRRQLVEMERIRDFVLTLPEYDQERWSASLEPLAVALTCELQVHEGTAEGIGTIFAAGFGPPELTDLAP